MPTGKKNTSEKNKTKKNQLMSKKLDMKDSNDVNSILHFSLQAPTMKKIRKNKQQIQTLQ